MTVLLPDIRRSRKQWFARAPRHRYITAADIGRAAPASPAPESAADAGAYLLFTSGSTGTPKGVLDQPQQRAGLRQERHRALPAGSGGSVQPGVRFLLRPVGARHVRRLGAGACLYCAPEGSLAGTGEFIRRCGLTFWLSVPATAAFMRQVRMLKPGSYPTLRWSLFCGEALPMALARAWQDAAPNSIVENLYGPTEATVAFTTYRLPKERSAELDALQTVPIGLPLQDQQVMVVDEDGKPLPDGEAGELCLGGSQVAGGYWRAADQTAERFRAPLCAEAAGMRWYRTGDLAVMSKEHGLVFRGRIDRQTKIRGYRVELMEVENAMRVAAGTDTVGAVPWPLGDGGLATGIVGFVCGSQKSAEEIIDGCRGTLPALHGADPHLPTRQVAAQPQRQDRLQADERISQAGRRLTMSKQRLIRSTILAMLPQGRGRSMLKDGSIDPSIKLLEVGLIDSTRACWTSFSRSRRAAASNSIRRRSTSKPA